MSFFFFNDTATTEIYTLSLHDALPIFSTGLASCSSSGGTISSSVTPGSLTIAAWISCVCGSIARWSFSQVRRLRSEEHTSELQSRQYLVCRLLLEKKKNNNSCRIILSN